MRIGLLTPATPAHLDRAVRLGLRSFEWVRWLDSPVGPATSNWQPAADAVAGEAQARGLRISALAAWYRNPLDPRQTEAARAAWRRGIQIASRLGVKTVTGFVGGVVKVRVNERGGNPVYDPLDDHLAEVLAFWEPLAEFAADHGVRLAFENCPQAPWPLPVMGYNLLAQPAQWERFFDATRWENLGLEWDPSHLICQFIDPVANLRQFGSRVFHVHAKDAHINRPLLARYGPCHPGVLEHRFPGLGEADWAQIVHTLLRIGYDSDLNIEGQQDPVYCDRPAPSDGSARGRNWEDAGIRVAKQTLERYVPLEDPT